MWVSWLLAGVGFGGMIRKRTIGECCEAEIRERQKANLMEKIKRIFAVFVKGDENNAHKALVNKSLVDELDVLANDFVNKFSDPVEYIGVKEISGEYYLRLGLFNDARLSWAKASGEAYKLGLYGNVVRLRERILEIPENGLADEERGINLVFLGDAYCKLGNYEKGDKLVARGIDLLERNGYRSFQRLEAAISDFKMRSSKSVTGESVVDR